MDVQQLRDELLILAAKKEIPYKESYVKKASEATLERIYEEVKKQQLHETNEMLTDLAIGKLSEMLFALGWIESADETGIRLQQKNYSDRTYVHSFQKSPRTFRLSGYSKAGLLLPKMLLKNK